MQFSQPIPIQGGQQQQQQQPVVFYPGVVNQNNNNGRVENYCWKQSNILGMLQIIIGIICFVCNSVSLGLSQQSNGRYAYTINIIGYGFWNGLLFIIAGILGVVAGRKRTQCSIIGFMVMCIISASFTVVLLSLAAVGVVYASLDSRWYVGCEDYMYSSYSYDSYYPATSAPCPQRDLVIAAEAVMICMAVIEAVVAIWGSVICCKVVCCGASSACTQVTFIPQYCCTTQQTYPMDTQQAPFQQVSYYVWPTSNDPNQQFPVNVNQMSPAIDPNAAMAWNPPPYNPSTQGFQPPPYEQPTEIKNGSIC